MTEGERARKAFKPSAAGQHRRRVEAMKLLDVNERATIGLSFAEVPDDMTQEGFLMRARLLSAMKDANRQEGITEGGDDV